MQISPILPLDRFPVGHIARIASVNWELLDPAEARRLREFGLYEGVEVEILHRGTFLFRDPLAIRIGRMRVAIRSVHAAAISLEPIAPSAPQAAAPSTSIGLAGA
jgi:ferrous iron transport protein A